MTDAERVTCPGCKETFDEGDVCPDGYCRGCHHSLGFDECCDGSWVARVLADSGRLPIEVKCPCGRGHVSGTRDQIATAAASLAVGCRNCGRQLTLTHGDEPFAAFRHVEGDKAIGRECPECGARAELPSNLPIVACMACGWKLAASSWTCPDCGLLIGPPLDGSPMPSYKPCGGKEYLSAAVFAGRVNPFDAMIAVHEPKKGAN